MTTSSQSKPDPARLSALKVIADEKLAVSRAMFETFRAVADAVLEQQRAIQQAELEADAAHPAARPYINARLAESRAAINNLLRERDAAQARSHEAAEASQRAGRLYLACRAYAIEHRVIPDPATGYVRPLEVAV